MRDLLAKHNIRYYNEFDSIIIPVELNKNKLIPFIKDTVPKYLDKEDLDYVIEKIKVGNVSKVTYKGIYK